MLGVVINPQDFSGLRDNRQSDPPLLAITRCKNSICRRWWRGIEQRNTIIGKFGLALTGLAEVYLAQRHFTEAEPLLKQALEIQEKALGPAQPPVAKVLPDYAPLRKQQRPREAAPLEKCAKNIKEVQQRGTKRGFV